eukprot:4493104-Amphidinium_carterae.1
MVLECNSSTDVIGLRMGQVAPHDLRALEQLQSSVAECGMGLLSSVQACVDKLSDAKTEPGVLKLAALAEADAQRLAAEAARKDEMRVVAGAAPQHDLEVPPAQPLEAPTQMDENPAQLKDGSDARSAQQPSSPSIASHRAEHDDEVKAQSVAEASIGDTQPETEAKKGAEPAVPKLATATPAKKPVEPKKKAASTVQSTLSTVKSGKGKGRSNTDELTK